MSILISGKNIPDSCDKCDLKRYVGSRTLVGMGSETLYECPFNKDLFTIKNQECRQPSCLLHKMPDCHGRLIDADALLQYARKHIGDKDIQALFNRIVEAQPTVVDAEYPDYREWSPKDFPELKFKLVSRSCAFCSNCTDIFYDSNGPYMFMCEKRLSFDRYCEFFQEDAKS